MSVSIQQSQEFINLKNIKFSDYQIIYHVNDGFKVNNLQDFKFKEQLLFQQFKNRTQQLNLMFVDTIFPMILADLALLVILKKTKSLADYINSKERIEFPKIIHDRIMQN